MVDPRFFETRGPFSLADLIDGLRVESLDEKFQDEMIHSASALDGSMPRDISFLSNKKSKDNLASAKATACFVTEELAPLVSAQHIVPLITTSPRAHFARAVGKLFKKREFTDAGSSAQIAKSARVHTTAVIGAGAVIKAEAVIGPYTVIGPGVEIGSKTIIGAHATIECTIIGDDSHIKPGAHIGGTGFGIAADENGAVNIPHIGTVIIGDRVLVGSGTCIDRGQLRNTEIHDDVKIDNLVQIGHNVRVGKGTMMAAHVGISGSCDIGENVQMGGSAGLTDHITVGDGASLAARAGAMHNIPPGEMWSGVPAMPIREHLRIIGATRKLIKKPKKDKS